MRDMTASVCCDTSVLTRRRCDESGALTSLFDPLNSDMKREQLIPSSVLRRQEEAEKKRQDQRQTMGVERANADERSFHRSVDATNDDYMREAMKKIRQDKRTHADSITSFNGTWLYNKTLESS